MILGLIIQTIIKNTQKPYIIGRREVTPRLLQYVYQLKYEHNIKFYMKKFQKLIPQVMPNNLKIKRKFKKCFYCFDHHLTYQNAFLEIEAVFQLFYRSIFDEPLCYLVE